MKLAVILIGLAICSCTILSRESRYFWVSSQVSFPLAPTPPPSANAALAPLPAPAPPLFVNQISPQTVDPIILKCAKRHNVRPSLVKGIVAAESQFKPNAISRRGALGLMQLMPQTAEQFGINPLDPMQNIDAGTRYLRVLLDRYSSHRNCLARAIAAYNAGPTMVDRYRGVPPFKETRAYVIRVLSYMRLYEGMRLNDGGRS
jgi:soluble lytic murein transglycosylase-like protein